MVAETFSLAENASLVHPKYFYISGFSDFSYSKYYFLSFLIVYIVSVCGNSFVLFLIVTHRSLHIPKYIGIFNLALADFGEANALIPNLLNTFVFGSQYISYNACLANMFFVFFFHVTQHTILTVMAYDRFVAICLPLRYHAIMNSIFLCVFFTALWLFDALLCAAVVYLVTQLSLCKSNEVKSFFCDHGPIYTLACNDNSKNYFMALLCTAVYFFQFTVIILSYLGIFLTVTKITTWEARLKTLKTCVSHLIVVGIVFLPTLGTYLAAVTFTLHPNIRIINTSLSMVIPPMVNPIIYVLNTKDFRDFAVKTFKKITILNPHSKQVKNIQIQTQKTVEIIFL